MKAFRVYEVKFQERYVVGKVGAPFEGHGLPPRQVYNMLDQQVVTGQVAILIVFEKDTGRTFEQRLDVLDEGLWWYLSGTRGKGERRLYPLDAFDELEPWANWWRGPVPPRDAPIEELGKFGEKLFAVLVRRRGGRVFQPDWIAVE